MATKTTLDTHLKSAGLGLPHLGASHSEDPVTKVALQKLDKPAGKPAGAPASALSAVAIDPTLAKVKATFRNIPIKLPGLSPTSENIDGMYEHFKVRVKQLSAPAVEHYAITKLARTLLLAPQGLAFALMDRPEMGDFSFNKGTFKYFFHGVGLHDGGHYAIGISNIAAYALEIFRENTQTAREKARVLLDRETQMGLRLSRAHYVHQTILAFADRELYYTVSEFMPHGDLCDHIVHLQKTKGTMPFLHRVIFGRKIMEGLENIHACGIIHRDVKDDNVLINLDKLDPYFCDLGFATPVDDESEFGVGRNCGTPKFIAPEIILGKPSTPKVDIWSAGVLLHSLLQLRDNLPWDKYNSGPEILQNIPKKTRWQLKFGFNFEAEDRPIKELLSKMISVDPTKRPTASEARKALENIEAALTKSSAAKAGDRVDEKEFQVVDKSHRAGSPPPKRDPEEDKERHLSALRSSTDLGSLSLSPLSLGSLSLGSLSPLGSLSVAELDKQMNELMAQLEADLDGRQ